MIYYDENTFRPYLIRNYCPVLEAMEVHFQKILSGNFGLKVAANQI